MNALMRRAITFKNCYLFVIVNLVLVIPITILYRIIPQFKIPFSIINKVISFLLSLYIFIGYIKYSYISNESKFRKIILIVISILVVDSIFSLIRGEIDASHNKIFAYLSLMYLSYPLLFYGFRLIRNEDSDLFQRLSRLNLYFFILIIFNGLFILVPWKIFIDSIRWVILLPFLGADLTVIFLLVYWEVKLFRRLSAKYDHLSVINIS